MDFQHQWSAPEIALEMGLDPTNRSEWPERLRQQEQETLEYVQYECPRCHSVIAVWFKQLPVESPICDHGAQKVVMLLAGFVRTEPSIPSQEKHTLL